MPLSSLFLRLLSHLSLWAILCLLIYLPLRLFSQRSPRAASVLGAISLVLWLLAFAFLGLVAIIGFDDDSITYPFAMVANWDITLLSILGIGGLLVHHASRKRLSWWQGALFHSLYFVILHVVIIFLAIITGEYAPGSHSLLTRLFSVPLFSWKSLDNTLDNFLVWFFPLGAPIAEIVSWSFRRASIANRDGYPA